MTGPIDPRDPGAPDDIDPRAPGDAARVAPGVSGSFEGADDATMRTG